MTKTYLIERANKDFPELTFVDAKYIDSQDERKNPSEIYLDLSDELFKKDYDNQIVWITYNDKYDYEEFECIMITNYLNKFDIFLR